MMKALVLEGPEKLGLCSRDVPEPVDGEVLVQVACCSVCRTDAKMWQSGHRDLVLPRIPGHEISGYREGDRTAPVAVWPGRSCGSCAACLAGRENLCGFMRITGFHRDGGFAEYVAVPRTSLLSLPQSLPVRLAALAEPLACALHGLDRAAVQAGERVLIYGGGSLGLFLALAARERGAVPVVLDPDSEKLEKSRMFREQIDVPGVAHPGEAKDWFDAAFNAAPVPATLSGLLKLRPGGRFCLFSNVPGLPESALSLVSGLHYRELQLTGSYGCTRRDMGAAIAMLDRHKEKLAFLVERTITMEQVSVIMPQVLSGKHFKFVVQF